MATTLDRRSFIAAAGGGLLSLTALDRLAAQDALARHSRRDEPYGPLRRTPDQRGVEVLALPAGFSYVTFSHTGSTMSDGNPTPLALDGMAAFPGRRPGEVRLIRNSEDRNRSESPVACWATPRPSTTPPAVAARRRSRTTSAGASSSPTGSR
jgi:secreted PhoX family phosphatase